MQKELRQFENTILVIGCLVWAVPIAFILFFAGWWVVNNLKFVAMSLVMFIAWATFMIWRQK